MIMTLWLAAAQTASTVAHAANTAQANWASEIARDTAATIIGLLMLGYLIWQGQQILRRLDGPGARNRSGM